MFRPHEVWIEDLRLKSSPQGPVPLPQSPVALVWYLGLVPGLNISAAAPCHLLILGLDFSYDPVQVQVPTVVHLHNDRCL